MVPKTWPWYATSPSIWSAKSLTSDRSSAAESAPPGTRNTCWKSSARCGRNLVNLDSLPWDRPKGNVDVTLQLGLGAPETADDLNEALGKRRVLAAAQRRDEIGRMQRYELKAAGNETHEGVIVGVA